MNAAQKSLVCSRFVKQRICRSLEGGLETLSFLGEYVF